MRCSNIWKLFLFQNVSKEIGGLWESLIKITKNIPELFTKSPSEGGMYFFTPSSAKE